MAGSILRLRDFLPALDSAWRLKVDNVRRGFHLVVTGMVKKGLIADWIAPLVNMAKANPVGQSSILLLPLGGSRVPARALGVLHAAGHALPPRPAQRS